jgi:tRNA(Ile)-lysidine synthase
LIDKMIRTIDSNKMLNQSDKVIVGVSGGPDSMCLLHSLISIKEKYGITIVTAHINHGLRGRESDEDEIYVKEYCEKNNIEFYSRRVDLNKIAEERKLSTETAGREIRYEFFLELMKRLKAHRIALAHNANDQAETVLMRIIRGAGIEGLTGIKPVRDNIFIRPLIDISRAEIESYCSDNGIEARVDRTNFENIYSRNKIRLELIPYINNNFNCNIVNGLGRLAKTLNVDNDFLEKEALVKYKKYCLNRDNRIVITKEAFDEHEAMLTRIIRNALIELTGSLYNFEKIHIYDIINIQKHITGKRSMLPRNVAAFNNYGSVELYICNNEDMPNIKENDEYILCEGKNIISERLMTVQLNVLSSKAVVNFNTNKMVKYFDYDKAKGDINIRYRKEGDRFTPLGMKGSRKLKDIFIDMKIPQAERDKIPLICFGNHIAWIIGYRVSEKYKVDVNTKNILEIIIESEEQR